MDNNENLNLEDIIFSDEFNIEIILNENYSNLICSIDSYFSALLLDVRVGNSIGYSFYNDDIYIENDYYKDGHNIYIEKVQARKDIQYLQSLILRKNKNNILEEFYNNTFSDYKLIEEELNLYIECINLILKLRITI